MENLRNKNIAVLGAGNSGMAAARLAKARGALSVTLLDGAPLEKLAKAADECRREKIELICGWQTKTSGLEKAFDLAIVSPGVPLTGSMCAAMNEKAVPIISELEFGASFCPWPLIGITGTNGKTTTVELLTHCLQTVGLRVTNGGNIGRPLSALALEGGDYDFVVVEVSSFQMETTRHLSTVASALLNVTPDHLSRHGTMEEYERLKLELLRQVKNGGTLVLNEKLLERKTVQTIAEYKKVWTFGYSHQATFFADEESLWNNIADEPCKVIDVAEMKISGKHNWENAMAVLALAKAVGVEPIQMLSGLKSFVGDAHRLAKVGEFEGVRYINDSKGTNVDALVRALEFLGPQVKGRGIVLIAGGLDKGCDLAEAKENLEKYTKKVFLIGQCRQRLAASWSDVVATECCESLAEAVDAARQCAEAGNIVLLCPACASMDMFRDYEDRGCQFEKIVRKINQSNNG